MDAITLLQNMVSALAEQTQRVSNDPALSEAAFADIRQAHLTLLNAARQLQNAHGWQMTHLRELQGKYL